MLYEGTEEKYERYDFEDIGDYTLDANGALGFRRLILAQAARYEDEPTTAAAELPTADDADTAEWVG